MYMENTRLLAIVDPDYRLMVGNRLEGSHIKIDYIRDIVPHTHELLENPANITATLQKHGLKYDGVILSDTTAHLIPTVTDTSTYGGRVIFLSFSSNAPDCEDGGVRYFNWTHKPEKDCIEDLSKMFGLS